MFIFVKEIIIALLEYSIIIIIVLLDFNSILVILFIVISVLEFI